MAFLSEKFFDTDSRINTRLMVYVSCVIDDRILK